MFHYIYTLPRNQYLLLMPLMLILSMILVCVVQRRIRKPWRIYAALFLAWGVVVVYETVINRAVGDYAVSLKPFASYIWALEQPEYYRTNFMNILLFFPGGVFLGLVMSDKKKGLIGACAAVLVLMVLSVCVEVLQYVLMRGTAEVDDVMHNTLGAIFGCGGALLINKISRWGMERK